MMIKHTKYRTTNNPIGAWVQKNPKLIASHARSPTSSPPISNESLHVPMLTTRLPKASRTKS